MKVLAIVGLGVALLVWTHVDVARACVLPPCRPGQFIPGNSAIVPANLPAIVWQPMDNGDPPDPSLVRLVALDDPNTPIPFVAQLVPNETYYTLVPSTPLVANKSYALSDATACADTGFTTPPSMFSVTAPAPLPTSLGITVAAPVKVGLLGVAGDTCFEVETVSASSIVTLALSDDAKPWRDVMLLSTSIDDQPWTITHRDGWPIQVGASWLGREVDEVYEICSGGSAAYDSGASDGMHAIAFHASLPGTDVELDAVAASVDLSCAGYAGGCSTSPSPPGALAGALVLLLAGRRRRARP